MDGVDVEGAGVAGVAGVRLEVVVGACPVDRGPLEPQAARMSMVGRTTAARAHERPTTHYFTEW